MYYTSHYGEYDAYHSLVVGSENGLIDPLHRGWRLGPAWGVVFLLCSVS